MYITIQKREKTVVKGRSEETWEDYHRTWCDVKSLYGKELYDSLEVDLQNVIKFETRYCQKLAGLNTKEYRVEWDGVYYNIIHVDYLDFRKQKLIIRAQAIV